MPYYTLNITLREPVSEFDAHGTLQDLGVSVCMDLIDAHGYDDTFEAMVFATTVLGPKQATAKIQLSRPVTVAVVLDCVSALSADENVAAAFWSEEGATPVELPL